MSRLTKTSPIKLLAFCILICAAGYSLFRMIGLRQQHLNVISELSATEARLPQILTLRKKPDRAAQQTSSEVTLAKIIEESATRSGLEPAQVVSIEPQSPRRVGNSSYEENATVIRVERASLVQLAKLAASLHQQNANTQPLEVASIRLSAPFQSGLRSSESTEEWNMELTLTYLVYSPKTRKS